MKATRYPSYKPGQSKNIPLLPEHWAELPLKRLFRLEKREPLDSDEIVTAFRDGTVTLRKNRREDGFTNALKEIGYQRIHRNDLVIHAMDAFAGAIGVSDSDGKSSPVYSACTARKDAIPHFYAYYLRDLALHGFIESLAKGIRERSTDFRWSDASMVAVPVPPASEQLAITSFLDRETAKIDALIAEQQRLIELLQEKRQAVISHAVTKGLNPNVPMKDSGVEWLGEVPEHWKIIKGSRIGRLFGSEQLSEEKVQAEGDIPFLKVSTLTDDSFEAKEPEWFVNRTDARAGQGSSGFLVFPKRGAAIFGNKVNVIHRESLIDPNLMGWTINEENSPVYYGYLLKTRRLEEIADVSTVPQINNKHINQEQWPSPPRSEQIEIEEFLLGAISRYDDLTGLASKAIGVLSERRSALISAAVTGQIDVRGLVPQAAEQ